MAQTNNISEKHTNLDLSIQVHLNGLSFCILDKSKNTIKYLKNVKFDKKLNPFEVLDRLKQFFISEAELQKKFNQILVIHNNELSTLVAGSLFDKNSLADYLKFNAKILKSDFIAFDTIETNNCANVYVPYVNINNYIFEKFGSFTYKHYSTILIDALLAENKGSTTENVYVHVGRGHFEIVVVKEGNLQLYNTFPYNTVEDFIYYILFTFEQLRLDTETQQLILLGNITKDDDLYKIVYKYVRHVHFLEHTPNNKVTKYSEAQHQNFIISNSF